MTRRYSGRQMRYYNPGEHPMPARAQGTGSAIGPIGNSRPQRKQRAKLTFADQLALAQHMGFRVPRVPAEQVRAEDQRDWITDWEKRYAAQ